MLNPYVSPFSSNIISLSTKFDGESAGNMLDGSFPGKGILWNRNPCIGNDAKNDTDKGIINFYIP